MSDIRWEIVEEPRDGCPDDPEVEYGDPDECEHLWQRTGYNPNWGDIFECSTCGGLTP